MTAQELHEQRLGIIAKQRELNDKVIAEKRDLNPEETEKYNKMEKEANEIKAKTDRLLKLEAAQKEIEQPTRPGIRADLNNEKKKGGPRAQPEYEEGFRAWMADDKHLSPEIRATLQKAPGAAGGGGASVFVPLEYETDYLKVVTNANIIRQLATVRTTSKDGVIPIATGLPTFGWIDELGTFPKTQGAYSSLSFSAWKYGGIVQISEELLDDADQDMSAIISDEGGTADGLTEEAAFIGGDGNKKPQGITTTSGVNVVTSGSATAVSTDDVLAMYFTTLRMYRAAGVYVFSDTAVFSLRKQKATTGEYLWQPSVAAGGPDLLNGRPFYTSDFTAAVPSTATANIVTGFYGDVKQYRVLDRRGFAIQRLNELYAETGQIGFRMWRRVDGKLLRPTAITLLQQKAS